MKQSLLLLICFLFLVIYPPYPSISKPLTVNTINYQQIMDSLLHSVDTSLEVIKKQQKKIIINTNLIKNHAKK